MAVLLTTKLLEIGRRFDKTQLPKTELLETLKDTAARLAEVDQPPPGSILVPMKALIKPEIFEHDDNEVRPLVATCISEIMRITTPEYKISEFIYTDDDLVKIFKRFLTMFRELQDIQSASFGRNAIILENLAKSHLSVRILNLQCDDLILEVFQIFFYEAREDHSENILRAMETILTEILNESNNISEELLSFLLNTLKGESENISSAAHKLAMNVMKSVAIKIEPNLSLFLTSTFENDMHHFLHNYKEIIFNIYQCAPQIFRSIVANLTLEVQVSVQKYTVERLLEVYRNYCWDCLNGLVGNFELAWIPAKILRFCHDMDFKCNYLEIMEDKVDFKLSTRSHAVDVLFSTSLFPSNLPLSQKVKQWIAIFSHFEKSGIKAVEEVLNQKKMLQENTHQFLLWKEKEKDIILNCFMNMSPSNDIPKILEDLIVLCQIKDNNIWKTLSSLLDSNLTFVQGKSMLDDMLKQFGDTHPQYQFLKAFAIRCSYFLFGKEHIKEMLREIATITGARKDKIVQSSMNLLVILARFFPSIFDGAVIDMLELLEEDNDDVKEGVVHILAIIGGKINEKIAESSHVDKLLEKLCLKGTRKQAMYAVQAIAAIKEDSGHKTLEGLYVALVHKLDLTDEHLATVLQSLGCIAQTAIAIFKSREDDVIDFICSKLLPGKMTTQIATDMSETGCNGRSKDCFLKICGLKAIVKIYLAYKDDAHLRIPSSKLNLFEVLRKLVSKGEISEEAQSSHVDKSHMRLAAAKAVLRVSRRWDSDISPHLFNLTLRTVQANANTGFDPYVKNQFLPKVHKYLKDKNLHHKYACAFVLSTDGRTQHDNLEATRYLVEFFKARRDTRVSSLQSHCNSCRGSPLCVLGYLICVMAHWPEFYVSNESLHAKAFDLACRQLQFFVSVILSEDRGTTEGNKMDTIDSIMSVFQSIRQDLGETADKAKSKIFCTLCDLGLLITKDFVHSQPNTQSKGKPKSLPRWYNKTLERSADGHLEGNSTASLVNRSPDKNGPGDEENLEVVEPSEQHGEKSQGAVVVPIEVIPAAAHSMSTPPVATIIPKRNQGKRKRGMPGQHSQSAARGISEELQLQQDDQPSTQKEPSCKVEQKGKRKIMVAEINLASPDVEKIESSKRKRGRPRKEPPVLSSQGQHRGRQQGMQEPEDTPRGISEEPQLQQDDQPIQECKPSTQKESSCKVERKGKGKTMVADINLASPDVEKIESSKRKRGRPRKEPHGISSQGQHQGMLEMSGRGLDDDGKNQKGAPRKILRRKSIPGEHEVAYSDGEEENLRMAKQCYEFIDGDEGNSQVC